MTAIQQIKHNIKIFNNNSPKSAIDLFLEKRKDRSNNTYRNYKNNIDEFFESIVGKSIEVLTWDDVINIKYQDVVLFTQHLKNKNNSAKTINRKMSAIKSLYKNSLKKHNSDIDLNVIDVESECIKHENKNSWGSLTEDEVFKLIEFCKKISPRSKPETQALFFKALFVTAIRHDALLKLKISDFKKVMDRKTGKYIYTINIFDKGKSIIVPIKTDFYLELKSIQTRQDGRIFDVCTDALRLTLKKFCIYNEIEDDRKIVLHSIKKASGDYTFKITGGDIIQTAKQLKHSNIQTTYEHYIGKNEGLSEMASYNMLDVKFDISNLKDCTKEELLEIINRAGNNIITTLVGIKNSK